MAKLRIYMFFDCYTYAYIPNLLRDIMNGSAKSIIAMWKCGSNK